MVLKEALDMVDTYRARRRMEMAPGVWREPEELLPEAAAWVRVDAYLHGGFITKAEVTEKEFRAAVKKFCPEQEQWLAALADLDPDVVLEGPHGSPRRYADPVLVPVKDDPAPKSAAAAKSPTKGATKAK